MLFIQLNRKYQIVNGKSTHLEGTVMASEAQIQANRANSRKSTGPRTADGKAAVAQNALKHGLRAEQVVIKGEDPGEFESYRDQMLGELAPDGALEAMLAERAVGLAWRLRRAEQLQAEVFDTMLDEEENSPVQKLARRMRFKGAGDGASALGRVATRDFGHAQVLYRLGMYERRIEHSLYKTLNELQKLRLVREIDEENQRQAEPDPATPAPPCPPAETPARQTKPISPAISTETPADAQAPADKGAFLLDNTGPLGYDPALAPAGQGPIRHGTWRAG
jgi:hypothetical protein